MLSRINKLLILRLSCFFCMAGWTWVHFYWQAPYGILFWNDGSYEWAQRFGMDWERFVGSSAEPGLIPQLLSPLSWVYLACTILTLTVHRKAYFQMGVLALGSACMGMLFYAKYISVQKQLPMLIEHGGQCLSPLLLIAALVLGVRHRVTIGLALTAFILTFAGHGAYAVGWPDPTPGNFHAMTSVITGLQYPSTKTFLLIAGTLDFMVCIGIFMRYKNLHLWSAGYATFWGLVTALARPVAGMSTDLHYWGADQCIHEAVLRAPHFLIPFFLLLCWKKKSTYSTAYNVEKAPSLLLPKTSFSQEMRPNYRLSAREKKVRNLLYAQVPSLI